MRKYANTLCIRRSPFFIEVEDPQRDLIDPAVQGTLNVLSSVIKNKSTVKRTVVTSSVAGIYSFVCLVLLTHTYAFFGKLVKALPVVAAVLGNESAASPTNGSLYTEDDWNETSSIKNNEAYWLSKVCSKACLGYSPKQNLPIVFSARAALLSKA